MIVFHSCPGFPRFLIAIYFGYRCQYWCRVVPGAGWRGESHRICQLNPYKSGEEILCDYTRVASSSNLHTPLQAISTRKTVCAENGLWQSPVATYLQRSRRAVGKVARKITGYTFEIKHCKGHQHQNADALSHYPSQAANKLDVTNPVDQSKHCSSVIVPVSVSPVNFPQFELAERTPEELQKLQETDQDISPMLQAVRDSKQPSTENIQGQSRRYRLLLQNGNNCTYVQDGLPFHQCEDNSGKKKWAQLVVPQVLRNEILGALHNGIAGGHLGEDKL